VCLIFRSSPAVPIVETQLAASLVCVLRAASGTATLNPIWESFRRAGNILRFDGPYRTQLEPARSTRSAAVTLESGEYLTGQFPSLAFSFETQVVTGSFHFH
jgi:hypothetical protein